MTVTRTGAIVATTMNPASGMPIADFHGHTKAEQEALLAGAVTAQRAWAVASHDYRAEALLRIAAALEEQAPELARLMTEEMGKPIAEAEGEARKCAWVCRHYAQHGAAMLAMDQIPTSANTSFVRYEPMGVILAVMPWNFPLWQVFRFAAPALAAGNALLIKHAPATLGCALAIEALVTKAGLPPGLLANVIVDIPDVAPLIDDPRVAAVTLTGSDRAGRAVASAAGGALKKAVLELGGSDPFIVFADADLQVAVAGAVLGRCMNSGQSCCASKRFIVHRSVAERFEAEFAAALEALVVGDPGRRETQVGPLAREDLLQALDRQVRASINAGARVVTGGVAVPGPGFYYTPTLLADVTPEMSVWTEETFGPVAALVAFDTEEEAVRLANDTPYGLCATIWTEDRERAKALAPQLDVGGVFVNHIAVSDPRIPFGGTKASGYGRELGTFGLREFVNVKTVWVD